MNKTDKAALELAMEQARFDPLTAEQLDSKIKGERLSVGRGWACPPEPWQDVAESAAYHCQIELLRLLPWQTPPCYCDGDGDGDGPGDVLLRKMLAAGVSRYHPDPLAALEAAHKV